MYPNAKVGNGGAPAPDWRAQLPDALKTKVPDGADGFIKDGDVIIFTKDGEALNGGKFNTDGSVYDPTKSENANPEVRTPSGTTPAGNGNGNAGRTGNGGNGNSSSIYNFGFNSGNTGDLTANFVNGSYSIDPNKFMGAAMGFNAMSTLSQMMPFGLGAVFANNSLGATLNGFMKSISFNFDFSRFSTSASAGDDTVSGGSDDGGTPPTDGGGKSIADIAKERGYAPTDTNGVYSNNGKFFKYDDKAKEFVECKADGTALGSSEQPAQTSPAPTSGQPAGQPTGQPTGTESPAPVDNTKPRKEPAQTGGQGYNVSKHSDRVFWKKSGGTTHYYIDQGGKKVEISGYNGRTYTLNGKTYDAKTGQEVKAEKPATPQKPAPQKTQRKQPSEAWLRANGYTKTGDFYKKNGKLWAYHPGTNRMIETREVYTGGYYRGGPTTMDLDGRVLGRHTSGANAGTYTHGTKGSYSVPGHNYGNGNAIVKETTARNNIDTDAQFQINGGKYNLHYRGTTLDYFDITGQRLGKPSSHAFINSDGSFNTNAGMFRDTNPGGKVYFEKCGGSKNNEFDGCELKPITDTNGYKCLCIVKNGVYYDFGTLMRTGRKVTVRPGTFISQG